MQRGCLLQERYYLQVLPLQQLEKPEIFIRPTFVYIKD